MPEMQEQTGLDTFLRIKTLRDIVGIDIEMHMHNDFGMAIANSIAGIKAGAKYVNTTINGLGERAGNAAFEEFVMAMKFLEGIDLGFNTRKFGEISDYVANASDRVIPAWKPIVGPNIFVFESENRIKLYASDHRNYELFDPEDVGLENKIIIGKYSGLFSLNSKLNSLGYKFNEKELPELLNIFINKSISLKRSLFDNEIIETCESYKKSR
jgi:homocitrate synthase NifV